MQLTITFTTPPATDLGYLLEKHPGRIQAFDLSFGEAHVFYPETAVERCTAAIFLDVDPVHLVRGQHGALEQYANDRPYTASSFMSVALAQVYGSALKGRSINRQSLADTPQPFAARLAVVRGRGGESLLRRLFEPLHDTVRSEPQPLDERFPDWGPSAYYALTLSATVRLRDLLAHLYVLLPAL